MRAIILDNQPLFRQALAQLVEQLESGISVTQGASEKDLVAFLADGASVDLAIIAGAVLERGDERGLARLRARLGDARVVLVAGSAARAEAERFVARGFSGVILRSDPAQMIRSALRLVLDGGIFLPPSSAGQDGPTANDGLRYVSRAKTSYGGMSEAPTKLPLTPRQITVLRLIGQGWSNKRIAVELRVSEGTVKVHVNAILRALNLKNRTQAALTANRAGLNDNTDPGQ